MKTSIATVSPSGAGVKRRNELHHGKSPGYPRQDVNFHLIAGTEDALSISKLEFRSYRDAAGWLAPLTRETIAFEPEAPFVRRLRHFLDAIRRAKPLVTAANPLRTLAATLAMQQGARGRP